MSRRLSAAAAACLWAAIANAPLATAQPAIVLDQCKTLDREALRATIERELAATRADVRADRRTLVIRCPDRVTANLSVAPGPGALALGRSLDLSEVPRNLRIKLLAVAAVELLSAASSAVPPDWSGSPSTARITGTSSEPSRSRTDALGRDGESSAAGSPLRDDRARTSSRGVATGRGTDGRPGTGAATNGADPTSRGTGDRPGTEPQTMFIDPAGRGPARRPNAATTFGDPMGRGPAGQPGTAAATTSGDPAARGTVVQPGTAAATTSGNPTGRGRAGQLGGDAATSGVDTAARGPGGDRVGGAATNRSIDADTLATRELGGGAAARSDEAPGRRGERRAAVAATGPAGETVGEIEARDRGRRGTVALVPRVGVRVYPRRPIPLAHAAVEAEVWWLVVGAAGAAGSTSDTLGTLWPYVATATVGTRPWCAGGADRICASVRGELGIAGVVARAANPNIEATDARARYAQLGVGVDALHTFRALAVALGIDAGWAGGLIATAPDRAPVRLDGLVITASVGLRWGR